VDYGKELEKLLNMTGEFQGRMRNGIMFLDGEEVGEVCLWLGFLGPVDFCFNEFKEDWRWL